ncbi:dihydroneopterin aldolase [Neorickettsia helminthoeca]|uniref:dihydroneopterin aldolase n=1 Tax=Neorickettsia helminthoeca TaxID=33994 RepID=UPI0018DC1B4F|nr:dihydroneopterin aldolase [Neorickettsia helminthoeca]
MSLTKLCLYVSLGVRDWEKVLKRLVWINLSISSEDLVDYNLVIDLLKNTSSTTKFDYIEELAETLLSDLVKEFSPLEISLEVIKHSLSRLLEHASIQVQYKKES